MAFVSTCTSCPTSGSLRPLLSSPTVSCSGESHGPWSGTWCPDILLAVPLVLFSPIHFISTRIICPDLKTESTAEASPKLHILNTLAKSFHLCICHLCLMHSHTQHPHPLSRRSLVSAQDLELLTQRLHSPRKASAPSRCKLQDEKGMLVMIPTVGEKKERKKKERGEEKRGREMKAMEERGDWSFLD